MGKLVNHLAHYETIGGALEICAHRGDDLDEFYLVHDVEFSTPVQLQLHVAHRLETRTES